MNQALNYLEIRIILTNLLGTGAAATAAKAHEKGFASMVKTTGEATLDEESKKGQFGWFPVLEVQMPYIIRSETPYIPTKVGNVGEEYDLDLPRLGY